LAPVLESSFDGETDIFTPVARDAFGMFGKLGLKGIVGVLVLLAGIGVVAWRDPVVAAGIGLVVVGFVLTAWGLVSGLLSSFGMGGMMGGGFE
jgi:hypothetical protein